MIMDCRFRWIILLLMVAVAAGAVRAQSGHTPTILNGGFEQIDPATKEPLGWVTDVSKGTQATIQVDDTVAHSGQRSIKVTDQSPTGPWLYAYVRSPLVPCEAETTYDITFWAKARNLRNSSVGVDLATGDSFREKLPAGTYDWQQITLTVATEPGQRELSVHFVIEGVTEALWIDDVSISLSSHRRAGLTERQYPKPFPGMFPCSGGKVSRHLLVCDTTGLPDEIIRPLAALQGIVNRTNPRIYLINKVTDPARVDEMWLAYMKEKGYTEQEERIADPVELIRRFRTEIAGVLIIDPELPGSINAAWMLAGLKNALPVNPQMAQMLGLPVVMDLRGRWKRNVDAYRYIYDHYWERMCHHVLAWQFPPSKRFQTQDYLVEFKVFQFWVSSPDDHEKGGDPKAEMDFAHEILANTPGGIPVFGWPAGDDPNYTYITEYMFSHLVSEYGKFIPGTDLNSNASVHSAIHLTAADGVLKQKSRELPCKVKLENDKVYVAFSIMDGDGTSVWEGWWQHIFADPLRGTVPLGYGMELCTIDIMPLVQRWYYEHATPAEAFYGLVYINEPVFANRFRKEDRERIWNRWIHYVDDHCRKLDLDAIEVLWSGVRRPNLPHDGILSRYTRGIKHLNYIMAELGRSTRADIPTDECTYLLDDTVVFHTVNNIHVWAANENFSTWTMERENAYILDELARFAPQRHPAFINVLGLCWRYNATWVDDLRKKLPPNYVLVRPGDLASLYREYRHEGGR
jgi:hypothetical protein